MQGQGKLEKVGSLPNLDELKSESKPLCEQCQSSPASFSYELFTSNHLVKGSRCAGCFLDLLRGLRCSSAGH